MNTISIFKWSLLVFASTFFGCFAPEYSQNYISSDEEDFEQYVQEAQGRPSPPARTTSQIGDTKIFITFSQPAVNGRDVWNDLVKYDEIWRTGANEATVFSCTGDVLVNGDTLKAGNYALYTIPNKGKWTVILNSKYDVWGAYDYEIEKDALRFDVIPYALPQPKERMTFEIDALGTASFGWERIGFEFFIMPI